MTTSTRDDRVHPYHARAFSKRLVDAKTEIAGNASPAPVATDIPGASDMLGVYYYENIEGGHGGAADNKQQAFMNVRIFILKSYLAIKYHLFTFVGFVSGFSVENNWKRQVVHMLYETCIILSEY